MRRQWKLKGLAMVLIALILAQSIVVPMERSYAVDGNYVKYYRYEKYNYDPAKLKFLEQLNVSYSNLSGIFENYVFDGRTLTFKDQMAYGKFLDNYKNIQDWGGKRLYTQTKGGIRILRNGAYSTYQMAGGTENTVYFLELVCSQSCAYNTKNDRGRPYTEWEMMPLANVYFLEVKDYATSKIGDVIDVDGKYPDNGVQGGAYYIKCELAYNAPSLNLAQSEGVGYPCTDSMKVSGNFKDLDTTQNVSVYYSLENAANGQVISSGLAANTRVSNGADHVLDFTYPLEPTFPVGTYNMIVWAQDSMGYKSPLKTIRMEKIAYPPTLTVNQAEGVNNPRTDSMMVSGNFKDLDKHQAVSVQYSLQTTSGQEVGRGFACNALKSNGVDHDFNYSIPLAPTLALGTYYIKLWSEDDQGYKSPVKTITVEKVTANQVNFLSTSSTANSLSFEAKANTTPYPLVAAPYRFKVEEAGATANFSAWKTQSAAGNISEVVGNLKFNTKYTVTVEAKNVKDVAGTAVKQVFTKAETPTLTAEMKREKQLNIKVTDNNPINTQYKIYVKDKAGVIKEVNNLGRLAPAGDNWLALGASKSISINDPTLNPGISYTITVKARNGSEEETSESAPAVTNVAIDKPVKLIRADITTTSKDAKVSWQPVKDAVNYKLKLSTGDKVVKELTTMDTTVTLTDLQFDCKYVVEIVASNDAGDSEVHKEYFQTKPAEFAAPKILKEACSTGNYAITLKWEAIPKSFGYQVEADGEVYSVGKETSFEHEGLPPNSRHVYRVRTLNQKGYSTWSEKISLQTTKNAPVTNAEPCNVSVTDDSMVLNWKPVKNASSYEIGYNGGVKIDNGPSNFCIRTGLKADTQYDYSVWAVNEFGQSSLVASGTAKTMALKTPKIDKVEETPEGFLVTWTAVPGAESYKVQQDGQDLGVTLTQPKYEIKGIGAKEVKNFSFAAVSAKGSSAWSKEISVEGISKLPQKPVGVSSTASSNMIVLTWADAEPDNDILYEVEVDGTPMESADKNKYKDEALEPFSTHTYRVRAKNTFALSEWTDPIVIRTLPGVPTSPKNICVENSTNFATLTWDATESVTGYEVAIKQADGTFKIVKIGGRNLYRQRGVLNVEQSYKVRGMNVIGTGDWSKLIVNNAIKANCKKEKEIDLGLTASQIVDFEKYELQVTYNPGAMDVTDLCGYSIEKELAPGKIKGTDIEVVSFTPGKIVFKVTKGIEQGYMWTGVVNNIKFKAKHAGGSYISYTVFIDESTKNTSGTAKKE